MAEEAKQDVAPPAPEPTEDVADEKAAVPSPEESKALVVAENDAEKPAATGGSHERDALLTRVATEKRISLIKAWEDNEKAKAENKAVKLLADITSWENSKAAELEAELKKMQEQLEKKKARCVEKLKNSAATVHKEAEEKRAAAEARRGEEIVAAEETAAKYRAKGEAPKKLLFGRG
ncbi:remorin-like [Triticum dicoccoides]|uniref:remorin-like n=1 Tax=Triticum dicoccoides TaxID=85692 RepID=UPI000E79496E|nr:remorin-like [Triticum dicoccoides]